MLPTCFARVRDGDGSASIAQSTAQHGVYDDSQDVTPFAVWPSLESEPGLEVESFEAFDDP